MYCTPACPTRPALSRLVAALATSVALVAAAPAQGATTNYPGGGSGFDVGAEGWTGSGASCSPLSGVGSLCNAANTYEGAVGNPGGSIATRVDVTANLVTLFRGTGTWTSPSFAVPAGGPATATTFQFDRRFDAGGLLNLGPASKVDVKLVDQTAGSTTTLLSETLGSADSAFATRGVGVPAGAVTAGHTYALKLETTTTTSLLALGVLGQSHTRFDNVALTVEQGSSGGDDGGGGDTPVVSPGVTITRDSLSNGQTNALFNRYNDKTEVASGPGGSLIPLAQCTIVGTSGADRIIGTRGNDVICGLGGADVIKGAGGIDMVDGAAGNDRLSGGPAKDKLIGLGGNDRLNGNAGSDRAGGGAGRDRLSGAAGKDRLAGGRAGDRLSGGRGRDRLLGGAGPDRISARDRTPDRVDGGKGRDRATVDRGGRGARRRGSKALRFNDRVFRVERRR